MAQILSVIQPPLQCGQSHSTAPIHKKERSASSSNQTPTFVHYVNWRPSSAVALMHTGFHPSVTTSEISHTLVCEGTQPSLSGNNTLIFICLCNYPLSRNPTPPGPGSGSFHVQQQTLSPLLQLHLNLFVMTYRISSV